MPSWKKVITSGSDANLNEITASGGILTHQDILPNVDNTLSLGSSTNRFQLNGGTPVTVTGSGTANTITRFNGATEVQNSTITNTDSLTTIVHDNDGNDIFIVSGSNGELIKVTDTIGDTLFQVNDGSGISHFEVSSSGTLVAQNLEYVDQTFVLTYDSQSGNISFFSSSALIDTPTLDEVTDEGATTTNTISVGGITVTSMGTGTDNSVVVKNSSNQLVTDEIDSRVWGSSLVDASNGANNRLATFTDSNSLNGEANLTFNGSTLSVTGDVDSNDVTIDGWGSVSSSLSTLTSDVANIDSNVTLQDATDNGKSTTNAITASGFLINGTDNQIVNRTYNGSVGVDEGAIVLEPRTAGGETGITFASKQNEDSDYGYLWWYDDNDHYAFSGGSEENAALILGIQNDSSTTDFGGTADAVVIEAASNIFFNVGLSGAPGGISGSDFTKGKVYVGHAAEAFEIWHEGNFQPTGSTLQQVTDYGNTTTNNIVTTNSVFASTLTGSLLRLDENGTGMRMTNVGAFENSSGFHIFSNNALRFSTNGSSNEALNIDTSQNAFFSAEVSSSDVKIDGWNSISASLSTLTSDVANVDSNVTLDDATTNGNTTTNSITIGNATIPSNGRLVVGATSSIGYTAHFKSGSDAQLLIETDAPYDGGAGNTAGLRFKVEDTDNDTRAKAGIFYVNTDSNDWGRGELILATQGIQNNDNATPDDWKLKIDGTDSGKVYVSSSLNIGNVPNAGADTDKFLVLDSNGNVDYRTGAQVLSDIGGITENGGNLTPLQLVVDTKAQASGYTSWFGVSDIQSNPNRAFSTWIAPADGHLEEVIISPEQSNSTTDNIDLGLYVDGSQQSTTVSVAMGAAGTNKTFTFGSSNYSFTAGERLSLAFDKNTNTSDLYNVMVKFRLDN